MIIDLQKASMLKRVSAFILDLILLLVAITGVAFAASSILGYDRYTETIERIYAEYEAEYNVDFDISSEDYLKLGEEEKKVYDEVNKLINQDQEAIEAYSMTVNLALVITTVSVFGGYLLLEFLIPLILKNGQTVGKKVFGIGLIRKDGVRITTFMLFVRTVLGKSTVETMLPVYILLMTFFGGLGFTGLVLVAGFIVFQIALVASSKTRSAIHDLMAVTVAVDIGSQMIFENEAELIAYKNKLQAEKAARDKYIS